MEARAAMKVKRTRYKGVTLVEIMIVLLVTLVLVVGVSGYRYYAILNARKADIRITGARLASYLLNSWKGVGGHSGYSVYELEDPDDYDPSDPNDYDPSDQDSVEFGPGLALTFSEPGLPVPTGFSAMDGDASPNYRIVANGVNYYATLSYKDEAGDPRTLNVSVAWMNDYQAWDSSQPYQSVSLTTYADD